MSSHTFKKVRKSKFKKSVLALEIGAILLGGLSSTTSFAEASDKEENDKDNDYVIEIVGIRQSISKAIDIKREANQIVDGISAEDIGKFPDSNLAEALQRIPDVAIDRSGGEGRYITIRGLGPQFNAVTLNGRSLASTDNSRAFSFDTIASDLVSEIVVYKTQNAALKEGGLGGTVDIKTARPLHYDGLTISGSVKALNEGNSEETTPQGSLFISDTFMDNTLGALISVSYQERKNRTYKTNTGGLRTATTFGYRNLGYNGADDADGLPVVYRPIEVNRTVVDDDRKRIGLNGVLQYRPNDDLEIVVDYLYSKFEVETKYNTVSQWIAGPAAPGQDADIFRNVYGNEGLATEAETYSTAYDSNNVATHLTNMGGATAYNQRTFHRPTETQMFGFNAGYNINKKINVNFDLAHSKASLDNKGRDSRFSWETVEAPGVYEVDLTTTVPSIYGLHPTLVPNANDGGDNIRIRRQWYDGTDIESKNTDLSLDFEIDVSDSLFVRTGLSYDIAEKSSAFWQTDPSLQQLYHRLNNFVFTRPGDWEQSNNGILNVDSTNFGQSADINNDMWIINTQGFSNLINDPSFAQYALDWALNGGGPVGDTQARYDKFIQNGGFWAEQTGNSWNVKEKVTSLYLEADYEFESGGITGVLTGGLRYASTDVEATGFSRKIIAINEVACAEPQATGCLESEFAPSNRPDGLALDTADSDYSNVLPSISLVLGLTDDFILRLAASKSLTRPTLSDLGPKFQPAGLINVHGRSASGNNANLKPFESDNFDISMEWYFEEASVIALALYHKEIDNFITRGSEIVTINDIQVPAGNEDWRDFRVSLPVNSDSTKVYGASLNLTQTFDSGFGYQFNVTKVATSDNFDGSSFSEGSVVLTGLGDSMNLVGFYEQGPFAARLAYNVREKFLRRSDFPASLAWDGVFTEPVFDKEFGQLDARISYDINDNVNVFFEGINLTEENLHEHGRFENIFINFENFGRRFVLGVSAKF